MWLLHSPVTTATSTLLKWSGHLQPDPCSRTERARCLYFTSNCRGILVLSQQLKGVIELLRRCSPLLSSALAPWQHQQPRPVDDIGEASKCYSGCSPRELRDMGYMLAYNSDSEDFNIMPLAQHTRAERLRRQMLAKHAVL
ncbi:hypothetical protein DOTSEDRAFT_70637 [Dothistroma septosporum NZE10]|uniref:Uncharacterized protein n=1 Tax=Dothistroma septosporum (strain NZE10 / CBS 128990) TaxID=675120 RepID=N1PUS5_DOTSN|nr:hypothetical protein DOTSEDRAFT_70637 [Dothistroma septosporum NZE10]